MRAVQITRFGGPEALDVVDLPDPEPKGGQQLYDVSSAGTHQGMSPEMCQCPPAAGLFEHRYPGSAQRINYHASTAARRALV